MNFHDLKAMHYIAMAIFLICQTLYFKEGKKRLAMIHGLCGLMLIISGGAIAHTQGIDLSAPPKWLFVKMIIWLALMSLPPMIVKKFPHLKSFGLWLCNSLVLFAILLAIYKPLFL